MIRSLLRRSIGLVCLVVSCSTVGTAQTSAPSASLPAAKTVSCFFPASLRERARASIERHQWAREVERQVIEAAAPWRAMSDEALWDLMFGPTLTRSWMVWSSGHCPACKGSVPMYNWQMDALQQPWKVRCPHCRELFPKNDFAAFYRSGLNERGLFDPARADRSLLFNCEHPDPNDPLHGFGVDDGEGYVEGDRRWRFIGTYLIYGQWKQAVLGGLERLAIAYVVTGDPVYAHKAGVLLDRVADLYPSFDFASQAVLYEQRMGSAGYVSVWHDACEETRQLALIYDAVVEALPADEELVRFLSAQARRHGLANPKSSWADIRRNLEDGLLRDPLDHVAKISSNYPRTPMAVAVLWSVLAWPESREQVMQVLDEALERATAVDGVTGEKGLANYSAYTLSVVADLLAFWGRVQPDFLPEMLRRHPRLHQMFRFHIDTWCLQQYYPLSGDTGGFAQRIPQYAGVSFSKSQASGSGTLFRFLLPPSMYAFLWQLYELTGDVAFVQVLYQANDRRLEGLPYDLFTDDPAAFQRKVGEVIARHGADLQLRSVNKQQWCLAILRSGSGDRQRAAWLDYDSGGGHGHADGMNLGLFAKGLDLMPDFGYPPVQYGGWGSPRSAWYTMTAAHNTVLVDRRSHQGGQGKSTLWADGEMLHAVRASAPALIGGQQYERTVALVDLGGRDFYLLDLFRVVGGGEHVRFLSSHFGQVTPRGLALQPVPDPGWGGQMRAFRADSAPQPGWSVDWAVEDRYRYLPPDARVRLRCTDLTNNAQAYLCEGWISVGGYSSNEEAWIPRLAVRRVGEAPLASTFVAVIEPYERAPAVTAVRRLILQTTDGAPYPETHVALELALRRGGRDLLVAMDTENPLGLQPAFAESAEVAQPDWDLRTDARLAWVRLNRHGQVERIALCQGSRLGMGRVVVRLKEKVEFIEIVFRGGKGAVVTGDPALVKEMQ